MPADLPSQPTAWATSFCALLEDIAYSLHGDYTLSTDGVRTLIRGGGLSVSLLRTFRICLFRLALRLKDRLPHATIAQLSSENPAASYSPGQTDSLLAHLFLGTLQIPEANTWGRPGFSQLFAGGKPVEKTALAYLKTLILNFVGNGYEASDEKCPRFVFRLASGLGMQIITTSDEVVEEIPVSIVAQPSEPSAKKDAFVLVAANSAPGPGPAGIQEERIVGQSPALAITSILTPVIGPDEAVVTSRFPVHAFWQGHGREARVCGYINRNERPHKRYIIADALPLNVEEDGCEAQAKNVTREIRKLYAAFLGAKQAWHEEDEIMEDLRIELPPWGCGAFGGTLKIKIPCMMMAAALAGLQSQHMELFVTEDRKSELAGLPKPHMTVKELFHQVIALK